MPQIQLPIFAPGMTLITSELGVECRDDVVTYFNGCMPVFHHAVDDIRTFRMITSQFVVNGNARQRDIIRVFGIPAVSMKRAVRRYREKGAAGFYEPRRGRGAAVLTVEIIEQLQERLDAGMTCSEAARELDLKPNTVSKAIQAGRLRKKKTSDRDRRQPLPS